MNILQSIKIAREALENLEAQIKNTDIARLLDQMVQMQDGSEKTFNDAMYMVKQKASVVSLSELKDFIAKNQEYEKTLTSDEKEKRDKTYGPFIEPFVKRYQTNSEAETKNVSVGRLF